ncbi:MAG TPA: DUF2335 domain-containing protein [Alphaproteobacteria bacterium]
MNEQPEPPDTDDKKPTKDALPVPAEDEDAQRLKAALRNILRRAAIDPDDPDAQLIISAAHSWTYRGPIPPPGMLKQYDAVIPGLADRMVGGWDDERRHRHSLEDRAFEGDESRMNRAQYHALTLGLLGIVAAGVIAILDGWEAAAVVAIVAIGGPTAATALSRLVSLPRLDRNSD